MELKDEIKFHLNWASSHPWFERLYLKLKKDDIKIMVDFLEMNLNLNKGDFEFKLNRLFLYNPNKSKRWKEISELLMVINSNRELRG